MDQSLAEAGSEGFDYFEASPHAVIQSLWQRAMQLWLTDASTDTTFIFKPELGRPSYTYLPGDDLETFSRTAQSSIPTNLGREAWALA